MKRIAIALTFALAVALGGASQALAGTNGTAHSNRCHGVIRPPMLGIYGKGWVCTHDGWRWAF